jgi:hypothetical protein
MNRIMMLFVMAYAMSPSIAQKVRVDYDHGCSFARYKTYRWIQLPATQLPGAQLPEGQFPNQLMHERIVRYVEEALSARGLKHVETGGDLLVSYEMNVSEQQQFITTGSGWGWGSEFSTTTTEAILTGTLVVDLTDQRQKQLVFQGVSSETISSRPQKNTKTLQKAINKMFAKYPPGT